MDCSSPGSSVHGDSPGENTGVGCHVLLQGIFPTQGSNPGLPHCRQILYYKNYQGSPLHSRRLKNKTKQTEEKLASRDYPGGAVIKNPPLPMPGMLVWSLVRELSFYMSWGDSACMPQLESLPHLNEDPGQQNQTNKRERKKERSKFGYHFMKYSAFCTNVWDILVNYSASKEAEV